MPSRRRAFVVFGLLAGAAALGVVCLVPLTWLVVRGADDVRFAFPSGDTTQFALAWRHSVEQEDWVEVFVIRDDAIVLAATRFKTFGAGVPAHAGRHTRLDDGWVVMDGIDRRVDPLVVQAAAAEGYRLRIGDRWLALSERGAAPILHFEVIESPVIAFLWPAVRGWRAESVGMP